MPPKDTKPPETKPDPFVEIVFILLAFFIAAAVLNKILVIISQFLSGDVPSDSLLGKILLFFSPLFFLLNVLIFLLCVAGIVAIVYLYQELVKLRTIERKLLYPEIISTDSPAVNSHWERILNHVDSMNENDWRLAILEADIMLGGLLDTLSLPGDTIGDKLKAVEKSDFTTVDNAWDAHKIRNEIAHSGLSFNLNQREAKRVIDLYRTVFEEFKII